MNSIPELIEAFKGGEMVVLMDDEDRENEGDLVMAASHITPEAINFMARFGRGLICLTLTKERCERLKLPPMVSTNDTKLGTNFTVSIEAAEGVTTGISAADRAHTIKTAIAKDASPSDLNQPGHVFPLMAQPGGVLYRAGHTEAGCDLARLSGLDPAAVIVEILNDDGTMARRPDLEVFAEKHQLKIGTIADLIQYRLKHEKTVERVAESVVETDYGTFHLIAYLDGADLNMHYALVKGDMSEHEPTLVRVHVEDALGDKFGIRAHSTRWPLASAIEYIAKAGTGVVIVLGRHEPTQEVIKRIAHMHVKEGAFDSKWPQDGDSLKIIGAGSQILADLGLSQLRVLSSPKTIHALSGFGLEVVEYIPYSPL